VPTVAATIVEVWTIFSIELVCLEIELTRRCGRGLKWTLGEDRRSGISSNWELF
jgi:hypothetical protein